jgi:DNA-binding IclR family transcriptional regulator
MRIFELARVARRSHGFAELAGPVLTELAQATGETALLTRRHGNSVVCLDKREADGRLLRISYERGTVLPPNAGASALILFAWDDPVTLTDMLETTALRQYTPATPVRPADISATLALVRHQGHLVSHGTLDPDAVGVAAPVSNEDGAVIAAVSVVALASRATGERLGVLIDAVRRAAETLSSQLALVAN